MHFVIYVNKEYKVPPGITTNSNRRPNGLLHCHGPHRFGLPRGLNIGIEIEGEQLELTDSFGRLSLNGPTRCSFLGGLQPTPPVNIFVNQGQGQIRTLVMALDASEFSSVRRDDRLWDLQRNFLREFCRRNLEARITLAYDHGTTPIALAALQRTIREMNLTENVILSRTRGPIRIWTQDPMLFLRRGGANGETIALIPQGLHRGRTPVLVLDPVRTIVDSNVYFEGGDLRFIENSNPNNTALIVGPSSIMEHTRRRLTDQNNSQSYPAPVEIVRTINEYLNEFSRYDIRPENIIFRGGNEQGITFDTVLGRMSQEELRSLNPALLRMGNLQVPMAAVTGYHTDLAVFATGIQDDRGRQILMMSRPLILEDSCFQELVMRTRQLHSRPEGQTIAIERLTQQRNLIRTLYEYERGQYERFGFAIRDLPFEDVYPQPESRDNPPRSLVNYTNVVVDRNREGRTIIYLPVRGNNHPLDTQAIQAYQQVYGNRAEIVPIVGTARMQMSDGLLNCMVNVIERQ